MLGKLLSLGIGRPQAANENHPDGGVRDRKAHLADVHAFATGAALAVSVDTSPAALVSLYDYCRHLRDRPHRTA